jgi:hypothetical protein
MVCDPSPAGSALAAPGLSENGDAIHKIVQTILKASTADGCLLAMKRRAFATGHLPD